MWFPFMMEEGSQITISLEFLNAYSVLGPQRPGRARGYRRCHAVW